MEVVIYVCVCPDNHNGVITHLEPDILECEVKWALESITTNKASEGDGIPVELFQILKDDAVKVLHSICQHIWKTQQWPQDWKRLVFIPIPKKDSIKECSNYCTIPLISHVGKVMLKILQATELNWTDTCIGAWDSWGIVAPCKLLVCQLPEVLWCRSTSSSLWKCIYACLHSYSLFIHSAASFIHSFIHSLNEHKTPPIFHILWVYSREKNRQKSVPSLLLGRDR